MYLSVVTPCYNEEDNVVELYRQVKEVVSELGVERFEHIFIDNCSTDQTVPRLKALAEKEKNLKIIVNSKNFGHIRSPFHALTQTSGDAVVHMAADFQDPPKIIKSFVEKWREGYKIVVAVKNKSKENPFVFMLRKIYYSLLKKMSESAQIKNFTGFGLYDRVIIDTVKKFNDPEPYFRGMIAEIGFEVCEIEFVQPRRHKGKTKNNIFTLYDMALNGFVSHSRLPLRIAALIGFSVAVVDLAVAAIYLVRKLLNWYSFEVGMAPLVIGIFFVGAVQLFFIGVIGEYVGAIHLGIKNRPLVIEKERINFEGDDRFATKGASELTH